MKIRPRFGCMALVLAAATVTAVPSLRASAVPAARAGQVVLAARASGSGPGQNVSSVVAPSWQTNGTVWALASANGVVYVGGGFTSVRPPGDPLGTGEVSRTYLAAFNAGTGALITTFDPKISGVGGCSPNLPCGVTALAISPDGRTLYAGGGFAGVNGSHRGHLAAFDTSTGALVSTWKPAATGAVHSIAPSPDGSVVYVGGGFTKLDGVARSRAGAVSAATGALTAWAPQLNGVVTSVAVARDDSRVLVGGDFTSINGMARNAIASTNPATGTNEPWAATIEPYRPPGCIGQVKDIVISGTVAYIASEGTGAGCFDGDFAARVSDGGLVWQSDCLGATQALAVLNGWLYKGSHAHDCAYAPGGFPQVANPVHGWFTHHLLDQSLTDGSLGHWTPNTDNSNLGPRVMATGGQELFVGGAFTTVNNRPQQGFARFEPGPDTTAPKRPAAPTVISTSAGVDSVTFTAVSDPDDGTLTYAIYRDGGKRPIASVKATSWPWAEPVLHYRDAGLKPRSAHTYTVTASDGTKTSAKSPTSAKVTVSSKSPARSYSKTILADKPSFFWPLSEHSGPAAQDFSGHGFTGIYEPGTTHGVPGPITGDPATATAFDGHSGLVTSAKRVAAPAAFSIEGWFKTSTNTGGKLIGFGSSQTGMSPTYDRHVYLMNDGQLVFGVFNHGLFTIETPRVYNDGHWHYVVATLDPKAGMALYVDGQLVGTSPNAAAEPYIGYWRVGGDSLKGGWNLDYWKTNSQGTTEPYSYYVSGDIGEVAVYPYALSAARVAVHYAANALSH